MKKTMYEWAKKYRDMGWSIFPVEGKIPAVSEWVPYRTRLATDEELKEWYLDNSKYGIALVTGKISGVIVIDDDSMKSSGVPSELVKKINSTVKSKTGGGGMHYFVKYEEGFGNKVNIAGKSVDIRGEGGYVVVPPSKGTKYEYVWDSPPTKENLEKMPKFTASPEIVGHLKSDRYEYKTLDINDYLFLGEGGRDDALLRLSRSLLNKGLKENQTLDLILSINSNYKPPLPESQARKCFNQALRYYQEAKGNAIKQPKTTEEVAKSRIEERKLVKVAPSTGSKQLDELIEGFIPGNLYTLTGETNSGKTTLAANFAINLTKQKKKVLYIALETGNKIIEVMASILSNTAYDKLTDDDILIHNKYLDLFIDRDIPNVEELEKTIRGLDTHYALIIVDHIGYFIQDRANYLQEQANVLKQLRYLTKEKNTAIMLIAHLRKRDGRSKKDYVPTADDISGSAAFKQDSTDVMIVIRKKDETDLNGIMVTNEGYLYVVKTKGRSVGSVNLYFNDVDANDKRAFIKVGGGWIL